MFHKKKKLKPNKVESQSHLLKDISFLGPMGPLL